jgi:hypothetical protein
VESLNADHNIDMFQVMAEAKAAFQAGERQWFDSKEIEQVNEMNSLFTSREEFLDDIEEKINPGEDIYTIRQIMDELGYMDVIITKTIRSQIRSILDKKRIKCNIVRQTRKFCIDAKGFRKTTVPKTNG